MLINQQIEAKPVPNPYPHLPSISTTDLINLMRVDKTLGSERIANYIADAYDVINGQLIDIDFYSDNQLTNWLLRRYGGFMIDTAYHKQLWLRTYKRAVMHEAAAQIADNYVDYDTTSQGALAGDTQLTKSDRLRRIVNHCIADMRGISRNRVKLI